MDVKSRAIVGRTAGTALFAAIACCSMPLQAQEPDLGRCLRIADIAERVACYDAIARAEQEEPVPADDPGSPPPGRPEPAGEAAADTPRTEFGLSAAQRESRRPAEARQLDEIEAVVASAQEVGAGYWQFEMGDGATWRVMENRRRFRAPRPGDPVKIRRGSLGSYFLDVDGQPALRIKRVG